jgi:DNA-binding NarL/FixJ family response regulator
MDPPAGSRAGSHLPALFEHSPHGLLLTAATGGIQLANAESLRLSQRSAGEMLGPNWGVRIAPDDPSQLTMPRIGREECVREMERIDPNVPAILMSGHSEQELVRSVTDVCIRGRIQKPFHVEELDSVLRSASDVRVRTPCSAR